ncbi:hypothetical protein H074_20702 [Amycolatopsis decaplanina DSM 44594]|uniref:Uncharacterized protein n=1 Tax=Amycolatopsis decaplanina DSM 44594 TaxID=1284240 RepID=M2ZBA7_9PSEU|nr:hypothetical protein H074_20702 [Amycolatopsis decaplanina DSM 44594]
MVGDLSVDILSSLPDPDVLTRLASGRDVNIDCGSELRIGGSAWLFTESLTAQTDVVPLVLSAVGDDLPGEFVRSHIGSTGLLTEGIQRVDGQPTTTCVMTYFPEKQRLMVYPGRSGLRMSSADHLDSFLRLVEPYAPSCTWLSGHSLNGAQGERLQVLRSLREEMAARGSKVVLDLVPHRFRDLVGGLAKVDGMLGRIDGVVGELDTLDELLDSPRGLRGATADRMKYLAEELGVRYGLGVVQSRLGTDSYGQAVALDGTLVDWQEESIADRGMRGLGDRLAVKALTTAKYL